MDGDITGVHDLADFVVQNAVAVDDFVGAAVVADGLVGVEHHADAGIDVAGHDDEFESENGE